MSPTSSDPPPSRPESSGLHSVDQANDLAVRLGFLDAERAKPEMRAAAARLLHVLAPRPGDRVLDVGCGAGDATRAVAERVAPGGIAIGVDIDPLMVGEAKRRSAGAALPVQFRVGDIYTLDFPGASFDACRGERVFLHLREPARALGNLVRMLAPGGRLVLLERDIETRTIDADDRSVTRRLMNFWTDSFFNGWIGRALPRLFREAGLTDVGVEPFTRIDDDYAAFNAQYNPPRIVARAVEAGVVAADEGARWLAALDARARDGHFFATMTSFLVAGRRPA